MPGQGNLSQFAPVSGQGLSGQGLAYQPQFGV